jgi:molybdopterin-guanine dinucleotide biosynthesis protein A
VAEPIGAVLAGGLGRRIGGSKALVELGGRPLISYPLEAMRAALGEVVVIAKPDTKLPSLPGVPVRLEAETARHPIVGILEALANAAGRPVLVCAADLPFVTADVIRRIASADPSGSPAVIAATAAPSSRCSAAISRPRRSCCPPDQRRTAPCAP